MPKWLMDLWPWLGGNTDPVAAAAALAGVGVSIMGFIFTIAQLRQTQKALKATNTYTIQKDGRELAESIWADDDFRAYVLEHNHTRTYDPAVVRASHQKVALLVNFYISVYRQYKSSGVTKQLFASMGKDFSGFFKNKVVIDLFIDRLDRGVYGDEHREMVRHWCGEDPRELAHRYGSGSAGNLSSG